MVGTWPSPNNPGEWSVLIGWARVTCFTTVAEEGAPQRPHRLKVCEGVDPQVNFASFLGKKRQQMLEKKQMFNMEAI